MRRLKYLAIVTLVTAVLLELVLQAGHLVLALTGRSASGVAPATDNVVLCVGDSFTHGVGASSDEHSYPQQLERILRRDVGAQWSVVKCAWPGRNSRDVLENLDWQLAQYHPKLVYVLVGLNDEWGRPQVLDLRGAPAPAAALQPPSTWRLEWRTRRLALWLLGKLRGQGAAQATAAPLPEPAAQTDPTPPPAFDNPWTALEADELARAEELFHREIAEATGTSPSSHWGLVFTYWRMGAREKADEQIEWLRAEYARAPSEAVAYQICSSLSNIGRGKEVIELARGFVEKFEGSARLWAQLGWEEFLAGEQKRAEQSIERAVAALERQPDERGEVHARRVVILATTNGCEALRSLVEQFLARRNVEELKGLLGRMRGMLGALPGVLDELGVAAEPRAEIERTVQALEGPRDEWIKVCAAHLLQIAWRCHASGAEVALLTYPDPLPGTAMASAWAAAHAKVDRVAIAQEFESKTAGEDRSRYFVPDGHCNDAGYAIMAEIVAAHAISRIRAQAR